MAAERHLFDGGASAFAIIFRFNSVDASNYEQRLMCYEFVYSLKQIASLSAGDHTAIAEGSFQISEILRPTQAKAWLVVLVVLAHQTQISINLKRK